MIRPSSELARQLAATKCAAYADGTRDTLDSVVEALRALPPDAPASWAADELARWAPVYLAQQRRVFAEQAGVEL